MTQEFLDLGKDSDSFVASLDRNPENIIQVIWRKIFPEKVTSWEEPKPEVVEVKPVNIN